MKDSSDKDTSARGAAEIQAWMILRLSEVVGVPPAEIDSRLPFASFGLDSMTAYTLTGELADWIGRDLPATLFWEYPTVSTLSHHLAEEMALDGANPGDSARNLASANEPEED